MRDKKAYTPLTTREAGKKKKKQILCKTNVTSKGRVLIGQNGVVKGEVKCTNCDIYGTFDGKLEITEVLALKSSSKLNGDVKTGKLSIEPGAIFTGTCDMKTGGSSLSEISSANAKK